MHSNFYASNQRPQREWGRVALFVCLLIVAIPHLPAQPIEGATFGSWQVSCEVEADSGRQGCFLVQNLVLREGGQRVLQVAIGFVEQTPEPVALLSLPLGISLPPGARIEIGEEISERVAIERCEPKGCRAGLLLKENLLDGFKSAENLSITFFDGKRKPIVVPLSLDGFGAGMVALSQSKARSE